MKRLLTALVALPILIASILIPQLWWLFVALAAGAMVIGLWEFYQLAKRLKLKPDLVAGYTASVAFFTVALYNDVLFHLVVSQLVIIILTGGVLTAAALRGTEFDKMIQSVFERPATQPV